MKENLPCVAFSCSLSTGKAFEKGNLKGKKTSHDAKFPLSPVTKKQQQQAGGLASDSCGGRRDSGETLLYKVDINLH